LKFTYYVPTLLSANTALVKVLGEDREQYALSNFYSWTERRFPSKLVFPFQHLSVIRDPAIRHAMVAIGVLHERNKNISEIYKGQSLEAMEHYGKALHILLSPQPGATENKIHVSLLTCVLFVCLETLHGRHSSTLSPLRSGYKLFQEAKKKNTLDSTSFASQSTFRSLFVRLSCQITDFNRADCEHLVGLPPSTTQDDPIDFITLEDARTCLTKIVYRIVENQQIWIATNSKSPNLASTENHKSFRKSLLQYLQDIDQWILTFNFYLSHSPSALHTCDSYVLVICSFFLKLRLSMNIRNLIGVGEAPSIDFAHVLGLRGYLFDEYESYTRSRRKSSTTTELASQLVCPLHRLFNNRGMQEDLDPTSASQPNGADLFFFLGAFCTLVVASMCSQYPIVRHGAHEVVSQVCRCGKGWDTSLTVHVACLISPSADTTEWYGGALYEPGSVLDSPLLGSVISAEMGELLGLVHCFNDL